MEFKFDSRKMHYLLQDDGMLIVYYDGIEIGDLRIHPKSDRNYQYQCAKAMVKITFQSDELQKIK